MITVMNGRDTLGFLIASRNGAWRALDPDGEALGEFPDREVARAAVVRAAYTAREGVG
jgi:hypothetical protein